MTLAASAPALGSRKPWRQKSVLPGFGIAMGVTITALSH